MSTIRIRPPRERRPGEKPEYTVEWYGAMGDGLWLVLEDGRIICSHYWRIGARLHARRLRKAAS